MICLVALLAGLESVQSVPPAAIVASHASPARVEGGRAKVRSETLSAGKREVSARDEGAFEISATSEVKLNGRPCRFEDVPNGAVITKIVVDGLTGAVVTVHFRAGQ